MSHQTIRVWDPLVRIFHWSLASAFFIAYITEDDFMTVHEYAGYAVLSLIGIRLIWGIVGTKYARFSNFVTSPKTTIKYIKSIFTFNAERHIGHNPAGGAMIIALLVSLTLTATTGMLYYGIEDQSGLAASFVSGWPNFLNDPLEEIHEFFANLSIFLVIAHVAGVLIAAIQHGENLIASMWHGRKQADLDG
ncbi:MAG: cytochrome b/b6 domain-containing protein [Sedimenticolaceae bacterium]